MSALKLEHRVKAYSDCVGRLIQSQRTCVWKEDLFRANAVNEEDEEEDFIRIFL